MSLNYEQLKSKSLKRQKPITIEGVGDILVRPLSAGELKEASQLVQDAKKEGATGEEIGNTYGTRIVFLAVINEDGTPLFPSEKSIFEVLTYDDIKQVVESVANFSGLDRDEVKNSESPTIEG